MFDLRRKIACKDPAARGEWMNIDQMTASTCNEAAEFTSDKIFATILLSNVITNVSKIYNSDTRNGNMKLQMTQKVDSETLSKSWNIELGKAKKTVTQTTQRGV